MDAVRAAGFDTVEFAPFRSGALNVLAGIIASDEPRSTHTATGGAIAVGEGA
jgi:hypothetical protein